MADKKPAGKPAPKPSGGGGSSLEGQMVVIAAVAVLVLFVVAPTVLMFFGYTGKYTAVTDNFGDKVSNAFTSFVDTVGFLSIFISLLFVMGMIYAKTRHKEITEAYNARLKALDEIGKPKPLQSSLASSAVSPSAVPTTASMPVSIQNVVQNVVQNPVQAPTQSSGPRLSPFEKYMVSKGKPMAESHVALSNVNTENASTATSNTQSSQSMPSAQYEQVATNPKWIQIEKNMQSHNMSEWRVAILEADILLYEMLSQMGYDGNSIGEILKQVDKSNFITLDDAWKAHRIRNIIAHEGANYELSRDEAERTIRLYKRVFDEFYFV
ncbi:MAG: hypothetical protein QG568_309 [Patescibacteria group bacterium]|nr:hypothetical protein [Patescibacteria group bacterium]